MNGPCRPPRLQPAAGSNLFADRRSPASLQNAVVFSMGCHSALSVERRRRGASGRLATDVRGRGTAAYAGPRLRLGDSVDGRVLGSAQRRLAQGLRNGLTHRRGTRRGKQGYIGSPAGRSSVSTTRRRVRARSLRSTDVVARGATDAVHASALTSGVTRLSPTRSITGLMNRSLPLAAVHCRDEPGSEAHRPRQ